MSVQAGISGVIDREYSLVLVVLVLPAAHSTRLCTGLVTKAQAHQVESASLYYQPECQPGTTLSIRWDAGLQRLNEV